MYQLSPIFNAYQGFTASGLPLAGGLLYTYAAGTSTPLSTATTSSGAISNANPIQLGADGTPPNEIWLQPSQAYKFVLTDSTGANTRTFDNISGIDPLSIALTTRLADGTTVTNGAGMVAYNALLSYAAGTVGAALSREFWVPLLTTNTGAQNDAAFIATAAACQAAGGGTLRLPAGSFNHVSILFDPSVYTKVNIQGAGKLATILNKSGSTTTPCLDISAASLTTAFTRYGDFSIVGTSTSSCMRTTHLGIFSLHNIRWSNGLIGWENVGSLIGNVYDCDALGNARGYKPTVSSASVYPNLIAFRGGQWLGNTVWAADCVNGNGITFDNFDCEQNGTVGNTATGGIIVRSTVNAEVGFASYTFTNNTWFEGNLGGGGFVSENTTNLSLNFSDTHFFRSNTSTNPVLQCSIGTCEQVAMTNVEAVSSLSGGMTVGMSASRCTIINGQFTNLQDNSTSKSYVNVATSTNLIPLSTSLGISVGNSLVSQCYTMNGVTAALELPLQSDVAQGAGALIFVTGADNAGAAYSRLFHCSLRPGGGSGAQSNFVQISSTGTTVTTFSSSMAGLFFVLNITGGGNTARVTFLGMT